MKTGIFPIKSFFFFRLTKKCLLKLVFSHVSLSILFQIPLKLRKIYFNSKIFDSNVLRLDNSKTNRSPLNSRYDKRRSPESGGARLPNANAAELQSRALRDHARMLAQRPNAPTNVRDAPMEARRLLHHGPKRLQRSASPLIDKRRRHLRHG